MDKKHLRINPFSPDALCHVSLTAGKLWQFYFITLSTASSFALKLSNLCSCPRYIYTPLSERKEKRNRTSSSNCCTLDSHFHLLHNNKVQTFRFEQYSTAVHLDLRTLHTRVIYHLFHSNSTNNIFSSHSHLVYGNV